MSGKAASPSYFVLVKMKCLLPQKEGLNLKQNKKSQLPGPGMTRVHQLSTKIEIFGYHGLLNQEKGQGIK